MHAHPIGPQRRQQAAGPGVIAEAGDERCLAATAGEGGGGVGRGATSSEGERAGHVGATLDGPLGGDDDIEQQITERDQAEGLRWAHEKAGYALRRTG